MTAPATTGPGYTGRRDAARRAPDTLAPEIGRQHAHELVYAACGRVRETGTELAVELRQDPDVAALLGDDRIEALCHPAGYLGSAQAMVRSAVGVAAERTDAHGRDGSRQFQVRE